MREGVHFDLAGDFGTGDDVSSGVEAHIPYMLLREIQWRLHHNLLIVIEGLPSSIVVRFHNVVIINYYTPFRKEYCTTPTPIFPPGAILAPHVVNTARTQQAHLNFLIIF